MILKGILHPDGEGTGIVCKCSSFPLLPSGPENGQPVAPRKTVVLNPTHLNLIIEHLIDPAIQCV